MTQISDNQILTPKYEKVRWGCLKTPISIKWCFHVLSLLFLLSIFQVLASHPNQTIHIVFSLWDITLQPPVDHQLHICFSGKSLHLQSWNDAISYWSYWSSRSRWRNCWMLTELLPLKLRFSSATAISAFLPFEPFWPFVGQSF
jgi:hypothetical protein